MLPSEVLVKDMVMPFTPSVNPALGAVKLASTVGESSTITRTSLVHPLSSVTTA